MRFSRSDLARGIQDTREKTEAEERNTRGEDERRGRERAFFVARGTPLHAATTVAAGGGGGGGGNCEKPRQFRWAEWCAKQTVVARPSNHARVSAGSFLP